MRRLERVLRENVVARDLWAKEADFVYRVGQARMLFFSGAREAHIVGATASTLLEVDEAQDVQIAKFDRDIAPMAASTNATRVFWGTAWTSRTLLHRELDAARLAEEQHGDRRVFHLSAVQVSAEVPAYGRYVAEQVSRLGRSHPMVRTQYFSEEIDGQAGMFPEARRALMQGSHAPQEGPRMPGVYALLIDVAGEAETPLSLEEGGMLLERAQEAGLNSVETRRDATALTVVEVDLAGLSDPLVRRPTYRVMLRKQWVGVRHTELYGVLTGLAEHWHARWVVVDATGVGAGLASFLERALPGRVLPFLFNAASKSRLGWDFLSLVETGRYKEYQAAVWDSPQAQTARLFWGQCAACTLEVCSGPEQRIRWGVAQGTRDPASGAPLHDDLLLSAALCAVLDGQSWVFSAAPLVIQARDPLVELDRGF